MHTNPNDIHKLLAGGKLQEAIAALLTANLDANTHNAITLLSGSYENNEYRYLKHIISENIYILERNKIADALIILNKQAPHKPKSLTQAPIKPDEYFIGREDELAEIAKRFKTGHILMLVNGEGGIGKTTLAAKYWHDNFNTYHHTAYVFCEGNILEELKNKMSPALGVNLRNFAEDKQIAAIKDCMQAYPQPCLLILDNANEKADILEFRETFKDLTWHVLITSRCQKVLDAKQEISINHLPPDKAKALFLQHYKEDSPDFDSLLNKLLRALGYNTLCIEIFAKNLRELSPIGYTMQDFLSDFQKNGLYLGEKSFEIYTQYTDYVHKKAATTDDILNILYDLSRLNEAEKKTLTRFALLPPESHAVKLLIAAFTPENKPLFLKELIALAQKGWLTTNTDTYRLSPVIQQLILHKYRDTLWEVGKLLVKNVNAKLETDNGALLIPLHEAQSFAIFADSLIENINKEIAEIALLNGYLSNYYQNIGHLSKAIALVQKAADIYQAIEKQYNYSVCLEQIGAIYEAQGDIALAMSFYEKCLQVRKEYYAANPHDKNIKQALAILYNMLGGIYQKQRDIKKAKSFYEKGLQLKEDLYQANPHSETFKNGLAISYEKLGNIYEAQEDLEKAMSFYEKFNQLIEELYKANPSENIKNNLAISYFKLGNIYRQKKQWVEAITFLGKYNQFLTELYKANPNFVDLYNGLANSYYYFGKLYQDMNELPKVKAYYQQAEEIWIQLVVEVPDVMKYRENLEGVQRDLKGL